MAIGALGALLITIRTKDPQKNCYSTSQKYQGPWSQPNLALWLQGIQGDVCCRANLNTLAIP